MLDVVFVNLNVFMLHFVNVMLFPDYTSCDAFILVFGFSLRKCQLLDDRWWWISQLHGVDHAAS